MAERDIGLSEEAVQGIRAVVKATNLNDGRARFLTLPHPVQEELGNALPRKGNPGALLWEHFTETDEGLLVRISLDTGPKSRLEGRHSRLLPLRGPRAEEDLDALMQRQVDPEEDLGWRLIVPRSQWREEVDRAALEAFQSSGMYAAAAFGEATFNRIIRRRFLVNRMYGGIPPFMLHDMWKEWSEQHRTELAARPSTGGYGVESRRGRAVTVLKNDIHQDALHQSVRRYVQMDAGEAHVYRVYRTEMAAGQLVKVQFQCVPFGRSASSRYQQPESSGRGGRKRRGGSTARPRNLFHCPCYLVISRRRTDGEWTDHWTMFLLGAHNHPELPVNKRPLHPAIEHKLNVLVENKTPATEIEFQCNALGNVLQQMDQCEPGTALPNMAELLQEISAEDTQYIFHQWDCVTPRVRGGKGHANNRTVSLPPPSPSVMVMGENGQYMSPQQVPWGVQRQLLQQSQQGEEHGAAGAGTSLVGVSEAASSSSLPPPPSSSSSAMGAAGGISSPGNAGLALSGPMVTPARSASGMAPTTPVSSAAAAAAASSGGVIGPSSSGSRYDGAGLSLGLGGMPGNGGSTFEELSSTPQHGEADSAPQSKASRAEHERRAAAVGLRRMYATVRYHIERRDIFNIRNYVHHRKLNAQMTSSTATHAHEQVSYAPSGLASAASGMSSDHFAGVSGAPATPTVGSAGMSLAMPQYETPGAEGMGDADMAGGGGTYAQMLQLAQQLGGHVVPGGVMIPASSASLLESSWTSTAETGAGTGNDDDNGNGGDDDHDDDDDDDDDDDEEEEEDEEEERTRPPAKRQRNR